jgi:uncharacterized OsmC-like protein
MYTSTIKYLGDLRTECTHLASNTKILTDAPKDNKGKGEAFSPTDLVATSYASCVLTIMGIYCQEHKVNFEFAEAKVKKIMESNPRRIGKLEIEIDLRGNNWDEKTSQKVINAGKACPVARTLENNIEVEFTFIH